MRRGERVATARFQRAKSTGMTGERAEVRIFFSLKYRLDPPRLSNKTKLNGVPCNRVRGRMF